jgi:hypothetical protein
MKTKSIYIILTILGLTLIFTCDCTKKYNDEGPKYACVYGPAGIQACLNTTKDYCINSCKGTWHEGQKCP